MGGLEQFRRLLLDLPLLSADWVDLNILPHLKIGFFNIFYGCRTSLKVGLKIVEPIEGRVLGHF